MFFRRFVFLLSLIFYSVSAHAWVDLHAHWFIADEIPGKIFGSFYDPITTKNWKAIFVSRVNEKTLEESGVTIAVVSLYASPIYFHGYRDSIRRQIQKTQKFLKDHSNSWEFARSSAEARKIRDAGKNALVLSLEGASGILENDSDLTEFIDQAGISMVTLQHFIDDDLGGGAVMHAPYQFLNLKGWLRNFGFWPGSRGLTEAGHVLLDKLISRKVWVDMAHASYPVFNELADRYEKEHLPILVSHTVHEELNHSERALTTLQLKRVIESRGIVGLIPSDSMFSVRPEPFHPLAAFKDQWYRLRKYSVKSIGIGTDINAPIRTLPNGSTGYSDIGQFRQLTENLSGFSEIENEASFLSAWSHIR